MVQSVEMGVGELPLIEPFDTAHVEVPATKTALLKRRHVDAEEAGLPAGLAEPEPDVGLEAARQALFGGMTGVLGSLISTTTAENMAERAVAVSNLAKLFARGAMELGHPEVFGPRRLRRKGAFGGVYDRETAGVHAIKEMVSAIGKGNQPPLERRLEALTSSMKDAKAAGADELYLKLLKQANTLTDAIENQATVETANPGVELAGQALAREAELVEGSAATPSDLDGLLLEDHELDNDGYEDGMSKQSSSGLL